MQKLLKGHSAESDHKDLLALLQTLPLGPFNHPSLFDSGIYRKVSIFQYSCYNHLNGLTFKRISN